MEHANHIKNVRGASARESNNKNTYD